MKVEKGVGGCDVNIEIKIIVIFKSDIESVGVHGFYLFYNCGKVKIKKK